MQDYNARTPHKGAFWEDRYHTALIDVKNCFFQYPVYTVLNIVGAGAVIHPVDSGVVNHPVDWLYCGYQEIFYSKQRYSILDPETLFSRFKVSSHQRLKEETEVLIKRELGHADLDAESKWNECVAKSSKLFILNIQKTLG